MSYDDTEPTDKDRARTKVGDTSNNPATEDLTDEHINVVLARDGFLLGVASLADELAVIYSRKPSSLGKDGKSISWSDRVSALQKLAHQMRTEAAIEANATADRTATSRARNVAVW